MSTRGKHYTPTQVVIHIIAWSTLAVTVYQVLNGQMTVNPIQAVEQRLGRIAVYFMIASLACTPLVTVTGWREPIKRRRALGLYAFMYAALHFAVFLGIDYGFDLPQVLQLTEEKPFILLGLTAGIMLLALAITSFTWWIRRMGKGWQSLHRTVYLAAVIVVIHYGLALKANILTLRGDIIQPLLIGLLLSLLLILRIPAVRRWVSGMRQRVNGMAILHPR